MTWRVAQSLLELREQINIMFPKRSKIADGTIGDVSHASRTSDHNPWVRDGGTGIVTGMDITNDPLHGLDSEHLAEALRTSRDSRLKYVISNRKIASFDHNDFMWRPYSGKNAHNHHCHVSVKPTKTFYDNGKLWRIDHIVPVSQAPENKPHAVPSLTLVSGMTGDQVKVLQEKLKITNDGVFGQKTLEAVREFQQAHGLTPDGKVGPYTWEKL